MSLTTKVDALAARIGQEVKALWDAQAELGGASVTVSSEPPTNPLAGALWIDADTFSLFAFYNDAWVEAGQAGGSGSDTSALQSRVTLLELGIDLLA